MFLIKNSQKAHAIFETNFLFEFKLSNLISDFR